MTTKDDATNALSEAMFKAQYSDPGSDGVEIAWAHAAPLEGYRAALVRSQLREMGFDVVAADKETP